MTMQEWMPLAGVGMVAGWLCSLAIKGGGVGTIGDLIVGGLGGLAGPKLFALAGIQSSSVPGTLVFSFIGACAFLALFRIVSK